MLIRRQSASLCSSAAIFLSAVVAIGCSISMPSEAVPAKSNRKPAAPKTLLQQQADSISQWALISPAVKTPQSSPFAPSSKSPQSSPFAPPVTPDQSPFAPGSKLLQQGNVNK